MKIYDIQQGTREWHELRHGKIGGTTSSQLHTSGDAILNEMIAARLEKFDPMSVDSFVSDAMQRGIDMEPQARQYIEEYTGLKFIVPGWCESTEIPIMGFSPDGITKRTTAGIEIKSPGAKTHIEYIRCGNTVPQAHTHQIAQMFAVCPELDVVYFCSYRPECTIKPAHIVEVERGHNAPVIAKLGKLTFNQLAEMKIEAAQELQKQIESEIKEMEL